MILGDYPLTCWNGEMPGQEHCRMLLMAWQQFDKIEKKNMRKVVNRGEFCQYSFHARRRASLQMEQASSESCLGSTVGGCARKAHVADVEKAVRDCIISISYALQSS